MLIQIIVRLWFEINALNGGPVSFSAFLNLKTAGRSLMKFGMDFVPLDVTLNPHFLISCNQ